MFKLAIHSARVQAFLISALQASLILLCALCWWVLKDGQASYSAWLGGMTWWLPSLYFTYKVFKRRGARDARKIVSAFYWNEIIKLILVGVLLVVSFNYLTVSPAPYMSGFGVALLAIWLTPCYMLRYAVSKP